MTQLVMSCIEKTMGAASAGAYPIGMGVDLPYAGHGVGLVSPHVGQADIDVGLV